MPMDQGMKPTPAPTATITRENPMADQHAASPSRPVHLYTVDDGETYTYAATSAEAAIRKHIAFWKETTGETPPAADLPIIALREALRPILEDPRPQP